MLHAMGLEELVAASEGDYVRKAVEVARDGEANRRIRKLIAERRGVLFDRAEPIAALGETLLRIAAR